MLKVYVSRDGRLLEDTLGPDGKVPKDAVWVDLYQPTVEEEELVNTALGLDIPSEEEMRALEMSSRLYQEDKSLYMTATLLCGSDTEDPTCMPATFVLAGHRLITLRYAEPKPFRSFIANIHHHTVSTAGGEEVLAGLLDALVDRIADVLERVQSALDRYATEVFTIDEPSRKPDYNRVLRRLGHYHKLTANARESLVSLARMLSFLQRPEDEDLLSKAHHRSFATIANDINALADHSSFLGGNISFMLDATMGMVSNEQNDIMKVFSVAAVLFLPPTLIGSIYGMNFHFMPELDWFWGYPVSIGLMVASAVVPYAYFKIKGWL